MDWRRKSPRRRTWCWTMTTEEGWGGRRRRRPNWRPRPTQTRTTTSLQVNFPPSVVVWTFSSAYKETQHVRNRCSFCTQKALGVCRWRGHEVWCNCMKRFYGICFCFCFKMSLSFWNRLNAMLDDIMYLLFDNQFQEIKSRSYCQRSIELLLLRNPDIYYILLSYYSSTIWSRLLLIIENENTLKIIYLLYHTLLLVSIDES